MSGLRNWLVAGVLLIGGPLVGVLLLRHNQSAVHANASNPSALQSAPLDASSAPPNPAALTARDGVDQPDASTEMREP